VVTTSSSAGRCSLPLSLSLSLSLTWRHVRRKMGRLGSSAVVTTSSSAGRCAASTAGRVCTTRGTTNINTVKVDKLS
jgi:hypothetical protein